MSHATAIAQRTLEAAAAAAAAPRRPQLPETGATVVILLNCAISCDGPQTR